MKYCSLGLAPLHNEMKAIIPVQFEPVHLVSTSAGFTKEDPLWHARGFTMKFDDHGTVLQCGGNEIIVAVSSIIRMSWRKRLRWRGNLILVLHGHGYWEGTLEGVVTEKNALQFNIEAVFKYGYDCPCSLETWLDQLTMFRKTRQLELDLILNWQDFRSRGNIKDWTHAMNFLNFVTNPYSIVGSFCYPGLIFKVILYFQVHRKNLWK